MGCSLRNPTKYRQGLHLISICELKIGIAGNKLSGMHPSSAVFRDLTLRAWLLATGASSGKQPSSSWEKTNVLRMLHLGPVKNEYPLELGRLAVVVC